MNIEVPISIITQALDYWESTDMPLLRAPNPNDQILIIGWSLGQEKPVLLSRQPPVDEDYGEAALEAICMLPKDIPQCFTCNGETVATVSTGFSDYYGDYFSEITFDMFWHITLFQGWLDTNKIEICIQPS